MACKPSLLSCFALGLSPLFSDVAHLPGTILADILNEIPTEKEKIFIHSKRIKSAQ
jgi:hypothetical protein